MAKNKREHLRFTVAFDFDTVTTNSFSTVIFRKIIKDTADAISSVCTKPQTKVTSTIKEEIIK